VSAPEDIQRMLATGGWWLRRAVQAGQETKPAQCYTEGGFIRALGVAIGEARDRAQLHAIAALNAAAIDRLPPPWPATFKAMVAARVIAKGMAGTGPAAGDRP
jgi:hypothetical protein